MTVILPITPEQLCIKMQAESIEVWQSAMHLTEVGFAKEIAYEYSQTLQIMSESVDDLIADKTPENLVESYRTLKAQVEERLDFMSTRPQDTQEAIIRISVETQMAMFFLREFTKMGIF